MLYNHHSDELTPVVLVVFIDPYQKDQINHRIQFEMVGMDSFVVDCVMMGVIRKGLPWNSLFSVEDVLDSFSLPPSV